MEYLRTLLRKINFKGIVVGIIVGILIMLPFMVRPYEIMKTEILYTNNKGSYNDMYAFLYDELGDAQDNDALMVCWFNITVSRHILVQVTFDPVYTTIYRVGIAQHDNDTAVLVYDNVLPTEEVVYDFEVTRYGLYSCSVFMRNLNNSIISITVLSLVS